MMMLVSRRSTPITCLLFGVLCVTTTFTLFLLATKRQKQQPEKQQQQHHHRLSVSEPRDHNLDINHLKSYIDAKDFFKDLIDDDDDPSEAFVSERNNINPAHCTFASCFNVSMCTSGTLRVYIYPPATKQHALTKSYREILEIIRASKYYTEHAEDACLFIPGFDTLSRDILSEHVEHEAAQILTKSADYVRWWNNGRNHLVFNFYAGTYPDYAEADIRMDVGYAMLAKASISLQHMRHGYDISVPLPRDDWPAWASADLPSYFVDNVENSSRSLQNSNKLLLSFKGKRYVHGIGSESRDTLYLLNNKSDNVVLVVTCRHGRMWERLKDDRCDSDEVEFVHYDYQTLLNNSTFCLVPRGRRLGSYRFLEVLQAGCIPVVLSNEWILPFADELIDWSRAALVIDERVILELPEYLRGFISPTHFAWFNDNVQQQPAARIREMLVHGRFLWNAYFSSSEKIVMTVLHIINDRVLRARMGVPTSLKSEKQQQLANNIQQLRLPKSKWFQNQAGVGITHAAMLNVFENSVEPDGCNSLAQIKGLLPSCCGTAGITGDFPSKITLILRLSMQKYLLSSQFKSIAAVADNNNTVAIYDAVLRNFQSSTVYEWLLSNSSIAIVEKIIIVLTVPQESETLLVECSGGGGAQQKCNVHVEDFVNAVRTVASVWRRLHSVGVVIDSNINATNVFFVVDYWQWAVTAKITDYSCCCYHGF